MRHKIIRYSLNYGKITKKLKIIFYHLDQYAIKAIKKIIFFKGLGIINVIYRRQNIFVARKISRSFEYVYQSIHCYNLFIIFRKQYYELYF